MTLLLALLLCADAGTPVSVAVPEPALRVYRARAELPRAWAALVPGDFDFGKEMLAGFTDGAKRILITGPGAVRSQGDDLAVSLEAPPSCPLCQGIAHVNPAQLEAARRRPPPGTAVLYRLPQAKGRVLLAPRAEEPLCPPCLAP